jgi:hypothetical protein
VSDNELQRWLDSIPEAFAPIFLYPNGREEERVPQIGYLLWRNPNNASTRAAYPAMQHSQLKGDLLFRCKADLSNAPVLPLKGSGEIWSTGWDIPTRWAIDGAGRAWKDNAHGGAMSLCDMRELVAEEEGEEGRNYLRRLGGLPEEEPSWMRAARAAGWSPPAAG